MSASTPADYLRPYHDAVRRLGPGFPALLWQSRTTQRLRFDALLRLVLLEKTLLCDAGCGHADLLDHLRRRRIVLDHYIGIEAQPELARAAAQRAATYSNAVVVLADFVAEPNRLLVGADVTYFGGSLNTMNDELFYRTLKLACEASARTVALSFLCSPTRAHESHLHWRSIADVVTFARSLGTRVRRLDDYLDGDATIAWDV